MLPSGIKLMKERNQRLSKIDKKIEKLESFRILLLELMILVFMGFFFVFHVVCSFLLAVLLSWGGSGFGTLFSQFFYSWNFARMSVGIPFLILIIIFCYKLILVSNDESDVCRLIEMEIQKARQKLAMAGIDVTPYLEKLIWQSSPADPLYQVVNRLATKAGLPVPLLFICSLPVPNAYTITDTKHRSAIVLFEPLLKNMSISDIESVIGHELGHIISKDVQRGYIFGCALYALQAPLLAGAMMCSVKTREMLIYRKAEGPFIVRIIYAVFLYLFGILLQIIGFLPWSWAKGLEWWYDYYAEYLADARSVKITDNPIGMAEALIVLHHICDGSDRESFNPISIMDVHPPSTSRVRQFWPDFNGNFESAYCAIVRRRGWTY